MAKKLMAALFASRDFAHKNHLNTGSYAKHNALGEFYDGIVSEADTFAEMWMGFNNEKIGAIPTLESKSSGNPATILKKHMDEIHDMRDKACGECTALQNQFDNIIGLYLTTLYKLNFLE